jgi:hypothetical protein
MLRLAVQYCCGISARENLIIAALCKYAVCLDKPLKFVCWLTQTTELLKPD